jgi:ATP-dependent Clp protease ATP-binding subunit ClpB
MRREHEFSDILSNRASFRGFTPLHYAVIIDDIDVVRALLEGGADPTIKNDAGYLPVNFAQQSPAIEDMLHKSSIQVLSLYFICLFCKICFIES